MISKIRSAWAAASPGATTAGTVDGDLPGEHEQRAAVEVHDAPVAVTRRTAPASGPAARVSNATARSTATESATASVSRSAPSAVIIAVLTTSFRAAPAAEDTLLCARLPSGFQPRIDIVAADWTGKLGWVAAGLGVALLPALAIRSLQPLPHSAIRSSPSARRSG